MLVLTRKPGQKVQLGESIVVVVLETRGGRVRLGIEAPPEIRVVRSEIAPEGPRSLPATRLRPPTRGR
jgi:carbon storage regulator